MKLIYNKSPDPQVRNLEIREHDWRPIPVRLRVQGCVPGLVFEMSLAMAQPLPPPGQWPHATGTLNSMFGAKVDPRFCMSEIVRCRLDAALFSEFFESSPRFGEQILDLLIDCRNNQPETAHLDTYIAAAQQVLNRRCAQVAPGAVGAV